jgi:flavin reductase (DIM6/NTAB) family NADH-FMN oxidoreductase RutF
LAKLTTRPSEIVRPPQVAESPINFECKTYQIIDFGSKPPSGSLVIGQIVSIHIEEKVLKDGHIDPEALDLVGRMGGDAIHPQYRTIRNGAPEGEALSSSRQVRTESFTVMFFLFPAQ